MERDLFILGNGFELSWMKASRATNSIFIQSVNLTAAHHIRNRSKQAYRSVCDLVAQYRWCLTGTPVHNSLDDYGALLGFIRVYPFETKSKFDSWIIKPVEKKQEWGIHHLQELVRATCLRRTKQKTLLSERLTLPPRSERIQEVYLHPDDQALYDSVKKATQKIAGSLENQPRDDLSAKDEDKNVVLLLNSLRLICNHGLQLMPESLKRMMKKGSIPYSGPGKPFCNKDCSSCGGEVDSDKSIILDQNGLCESCATSEEDSSKLQYREAEQVSRPARLKGIGPDKVIHKPSAKVIALLKNLKGENSSSVYEPKKGKRYTEICLSIHE